LARMSKATATNCSRDRPCISPVRIAFQGTENREQGTGIRSGVRDLGSGEERGDPLEPMTGGLRIELQMGDGNGCEPSHDSGLLIQSIYYSWGCARFVFHGRVWWLHRERVKSSGFG
jgi:hypothetical protein